MSDWPKFSDMNWLRLLEGPSDRVGLDIAPTMKRLVYKGERYNRMDMGRSSRDPDDGQERTERGGVYLWDGWMQKMLAERSQEGT